MIHTRICDLLRIVHPVVLGGMGTGTSAALVAAVESPIHENFKQAIVKSDGHDTVLTEIHDIIGGHVWPGAMARAKRNAYIERWAGREWALRANQREAARQAEEARRAGDVDNAALVFGQDAGLIDSIEPAADIIAGMVSDADAIIRRSLNKLLRD